LFGQKLKGKFSLVKTHREKQWLLIKGNEDLTITRPESIVSGRTNQDLEKEEHRVKTKNPG
jgi:bifunctional non-homologous end joining protein LigD